MRTTFGCVALGFKLEREGRWLHQFADHLRAAGPSDTDQRPLAWAAQRARAQSNASCSCGLSICGPTRISLCGEGCFDDRRVHTLGRGQVACCSAAPSRHPTRRLFTRLCPDRQGRYRGCMVDLPGLAHTDQRGSLYHEPASWAEQILGVDHAAVGPQRDQPAWLIEEHRKGSRRKRTRHRGSADDRHVSEREPNCAYPGESSADDPLMFDAAIVDLMLWRLACRVANHHPRDTDRGIRCANASCGRTYPCYPRRSAILAAAASRRPWPAPWTARGNLASLGFALSRGL